MSQRASEGVCAFCRWVLQAYILHHHHRLLLLVAGNAFLLQDMVQSIALLTLATCIILQWKGQREGTCTVLVWGW